jgi:hypothetical protein
VRERSLFGMLGCDSEALRRNRCLGCWGAIAFGNVGCDRFWGVGVRSLFEDVRRAIVFWDVGVIAKRSVGIAVWDVGVRSLLGMWGAIAFGNVGCDRFWECGSAIAVWDVGSAIAFRVWECDRFWDVGSAIAVLRDVGNAIAKRSVGIAVWGFGGCAIAVLGVWGCDRFWGVGVRSLFGVLRGCDSEALRRNRFLGMCGVRSLVEDVGVRSLFWGCGRAIKKLNFLI